MIDEERRTTEVGTMRGIVVVATAMVIISPTIIIIAKAREWMSVLR
jgi:hypothetical protein